MGYSFEEFYAAIKHLAELNGLDEELAGELMAYIGDTPEENVKGRVIAKDEQGREYHLIRPSEEPDLSEEEIAEWGDEPYEAQAQKIRQDSQIDLDI